MIIWGFDVSSWQSQGSMLGNDRWDLSDLNRFPLEEMREHGCRFGIVKYSMQLGKDQTAEDHTHYIESADMETGGYHWCDPIANFNLQRDLFTEQIQDLEPVIQAYDVEQYWASWDDKTKILSEDAIVDNFLYLFEETSGLSHNHLMYTANWFINKYVPTRSSELNVCDGWYANYVFWRQYVQSNFRTYQLSTWEQFHETLYWFYHNWRNFYDGSSPSRTLIPPGLDEPTIIQVDSKTKLPGCPYNIDLNVFNGSEKDYEEWFSGIENNGEEKTIPERLRNEAESIRISAGNIEGIANQIG